MKKSFVIAVFILICFGIKAIAVNPDVCYVKTADKVYFGQDVKVRMIYTKIISADGTIAKVKTSEVKAYMHDNKLFEAMPLICLDGDTLCEAFMEKMATRSGLSLYRYKCCTDCGVTCIYFVYKDNKLHLRVDSYNAESVLPFFGVKSVVVT